MSIARQASGRSSPPRQGDPNRWWARVFGGMFLAGAATHIILVTTKPSSYGSFADGSWWPFIAHAWRSVLLPNVRFLIPLLVLFEAAAGLLILSRAYRRIGIGAAIAFNAALILFGWGFCLWSVPVIVLLLRFWYLESEARSTSAACNSGETDMAMSPDRDRAG